MSDEFERTKSQYISRLATIKIPIDPSAGVVKGLLSRLDGFFSEARIEFADIESKKFQLETIIHEAERTKAVGPNETARKKNATEAIQRYELDGETVNLYQLLRDVNKEYNFFKGILDILNAKQSRLITTSGILKIERSLAPNAALE